MQGVSLGQRFLSAKLAGRKLGDGESAYEYQFRSNEWAATAACGEVAAWLAEWAEFYDGGATTPEEAIKAQVLRELAVKAAGR